jgi:hypothetical protein
MLITTFAHSQAQSQEMEEWARARAGNELNQGMRECSSQVLATPKTHPNTARRRSWKSSVKGFVRKNTQSSIIKKNNNYGYKSKTLACS